MFFTDFKLLRISAQDFSETIRRPTAELTRFHYFIPAMTM